MAHVNLQATTRNEIGHQTRQLRKAGFIPAVIYSKNFPSKNLTINIREFYKVFKEAGKTHVVDLAVDDGKKTLPCIVHDIDVHPVTGRPRHVDFLSVNLKEKVKASVPVIYIGEAPGVKEFGAVLLTPVQELEVEALPDNIPSQIEVNVAVLATLNDSIHVEDLMKSADFEILEDSELLLASLTSQSADEPETASEEAVVEKSTNTEKE